MFLSDCLTHFLHLKIKFEGQRPPKKECQFFCGTSCSQKMLDRLTHILLLLMPPLILVFFLINSSCPIMIPGMRREFIIFFPSSENFFLKNLLVPKSHFLICGIQRNIYTYI